MSKQVRQASYTDYSNSYNELDFVIRQKITNINTAIIVKVLKVKKETKCVDVISLVQQISADGTVIDHETVYNIPYFLLQGGINGVIITPAVNDIGLLVCCSRDVSAVKNAKQAAPPSSRRMHTLSDGLYLGGFLNEDAARYIKFNDNGMEIDPLSLLKIIGNLTVTDTIQAETVRTNNLYLRGKSINDIFDGMQKQIDQLQKDVDNLKKMIEEMYITRAFTNEGNAEINEGNAE